MASPRPLGVLGFWIRVYRRRPRARSTDKFRFWLLRLAGLAGLVAGSFFWLWGFNYARTPLEQQIGLRYKSQYRIHISPGILADDRAIRIQPSQYRELAPNLRYQTYNAYLKAQGIASGMGNYDDVLKWVQAGLSRIGFRARLRHVLFTSQTTNTVFIR